jgi:SAM-dependent methyltransferase
VSTPLRPVRSLRDLYHAVWGERLHAGLSPEGGENIEAATLAADRLLAGLAVPSAGETVLEIGCGFGLIARIFAEEHGCSVTAVDSEEWRLQRARALGKGIPGLSFRRADAHQLPFAAATFDIVIAQEALGFTGDPEAAVSEAARVVKPDGRIVVSDFWTAADVDGEIGVLFGRCRFPTRGQWKGAFKSAGRRVRDWHDLGVETHTFCETLAHAFLACDGVRWPLRKAASNTMLNRAALIAEGSLGKFAALA